MFSTRGMLSWFACCALPLFCVAANAQLTIEADVIYGRKDGMALTYDVLKPENANGAAVIFMMSGGWYSSWSPPERVALRFADLLRRSLVHRLDGLRYRLYGRLDEYSEPPKILRRSRSDHRVPETEGS